MTDGATPKLIRSDKESICLPNSDTEFSNRATKPSQKSNTAANIISTTASLVSPCIASTEAHTPQTIFSEVTNDGNAAFILFIPFF